MMSPEAVRQALERFDLTQPAVRQRVNRFAKTHPEFDFLLPEIRNELRQGYSLLMAYRRACAEARRNLREGR